MIFNSASRVGLPQTSQALRLPSDGSGDCALPAVPIYVPCMESVTTFLSDACEVAPRDIEQTPVSFSLAKLYHRRD
jgi:hypothetical protein